MPAMDEGLRLEIRGLKETQKKMEQVARDLSGPPMLAAMRDATMVVQRDAKKLAPVNTGRLRASIIPEVRASVVGRTITGVVGSNVEYAPYVETGTRPHFPPLAAIQRWVHLKRLGTPKTERSIAYAICRAIAVRGTRARPYLEPAFRKNYNRIRKIIGDAVGRIVIK